MKNKKVTAGMQFLPDDNASWEEHASALLDHWLVIRDVEFKPNEESGLDVWIAVRSCEQDCDNHISINGNDMADGLISEMPYRDIEEVAACREFFEIVAEKLRTEEANHPQA